MKVFLRLTLVFLLTIFVFQSCILDEFKFDELSMKDDWGMPVVVPLVKGSFQLEDLLDEGDLQQIPLSEEGVIVRYPDGKTVYLPQSVLFEPKVVLDDFSFLVNGNYRLDDIDFDFMVENGTPLPINIQLRFFSEGGQTFGPVILPSSFQGTSLKSGVSIPIKSKQRIKLSQEQIKSFQDGNRLELSTWFDAVPDDHMPDTIYTQSSVKLSVVLNAIMKGDQVE